MQLLHLHHPLQWAVVCDCTIAGWVWVMLLVLQPAMVPHADVDADNNWHSSMSSRRMSYVTLSVLLVVVALLLVVWHWWCHAVATTCHIWWDNHVVQPAMDPASSWPLVAPYPPWLLQWCCYLDYRDCDRARHDLEQVVVPAPAWHRHHPSLVCHSSCCYWHVYNWLHHQRHHQHFHCCHCHAYNRNWALALFPAHISQLLSSLYFESSSAYRDSDAAAVAAVAVVQLIHLLWPLAAVELLHHAARWAVHSVVDIFVHNSDLAAVRWWCRAVRCWD